MSLFNIIWRYSLGEITLEEANQLFTKLDYSFTKNQTMNSIKKQKRHQLKIKQVDAQRYYGGIKPFVICENLDYEIGDIIEFTIIEMKARYERKIIYIEKDVPGLKDGYCIITLSGYEYIL